MKNLIFLGVFQSLPADVASIISGYSDFRLGQSRPLRIAWEVKCDNSQESDFYSRSKASDGDALFAIATQYMSNNFIQIYSMGKLYSTFPIPAKCRIFFHEFTIIAIQECVDFTDLPTVLVTLDVNTFNIYGELLQKCQIKSDKKWDRHFMMFDSCGNIVLKHFNYQPLRNKHDSAELCTYCLKKGTLLRSETVQKLFFRRNEKDCIFSVDNIDNESQYAYIQKHDINNKNEIVAKIRIQKERHDTCYLSCCVPGHPEKLLISMKIHRRIILVDFENPQVYSVVLENPPSFVEISVGSSGKLFAEGWGFVRCYE